MEQQDSDIPCTPSAVPRDTEQRSTRQSPSPLPSTFTLTPAPQLRTATPISRPTTPATASLTATSPNRSSLSTSEPTLRFPRPQGNRHLANWISSSNPDIMRITTTTEDTGLSESTYELISGTDTESQDDNYTESISESVGSLDFHRADDVHSLAGTEQTNDDESLADENEAHSQQPQDELEDTSDIVDINQTPRAQQSWASIVKNGDLPEVEPDAEPELEPDSKAEPEPEPESEDEARSRSSLEYTQQSLKTPSIPSPDASYTDDKSNQRPCHDDVAEEAKSQRARFNKWLTELQEPPVPTWQTVKKAVVNFALPSFVMVAVVSLIPLILTTYSTHLRDAAPHNPAATSAVTTHPTLLSYTSSQTPSSTLQALVTSAGAALVPLENARSDEWLWGGKQPEVTVTKHQGNFLIHMPQDVKKSWLDRDCLGFAAKRGEELVRFGTSPVNEGILLKFPKEESHGTVKVDIYTTCRPRIRKVLRITFGKGIILEALELTKAFAQDLTEFVPAAAQEAERRLECAKRSLETASGNFKTTSDSLCKDIGARFYNAHRSLGWIKVNIRDCIREAKRDIAKKIEAVASDTKQRIPSADAVQQRAELGLLNAQIRAKLWWLKLTADDDEHDRYQRAAKQLIATKLVKDKYFRKPAKEANKAWNLESIFRTWPRKQPQDS
ncbi:hypothetical protein F66182_9492 [Fusarium sp. NRRL 66182]|nr:hypothetical protein F66182_9492 [Fusarium sp. NRRL 66182]